MIDSYSYYTLEEILFNIISLLFIFHLYYCLYGSSRLSKKHVILQGIILGTATTLLLRLVLASFRPATLPPILFLCSFLFLGYYEKAKGKKLLFSAILFSFSCLYLLMTDFILTPLQTPYATLIFHLGFWLLLELIGHMGKYQTASITLPLWGLLFMISLLSLGAFFIIFIFVIQSEKPYDLTTELPISLILIIINLCLFVFFDRFSALFGERRKKELLEQHIALQNAHYKELEAAYSSLRSMKHDMKNYLQTAANLAQEEDNKNALFHFLSHATGQLEEISKVISTGNPEIDSVLNIKFHEIIQQNIKLSHQLEFPAGILFTFEQAVTILGNLLDNAMEACLKLPEEKRHLSIQMKYRSHTLYIKIENSSLPIAKWKNGFPLSDKENHSLHGIGLKSVAEMISQQGTMECSFSSDTFLVQLVLYDC